MGTENHQTRPGRRGLPPRLVLGLGLAIGLDTAVQTIWKRAAQSLPVTAPVDPLGAMIAAAHQPLFIAVGVMIAAQMANWLKVLDDADVSYALPITALSYLSVAAVSALWLHEALTPGRLAGMALILIGVVLVARTEHNTLNPS